MIGTRLARGHRRSTAVALICSAIAMAGLGQGPAVATHSTVTAVKGSAFGYWADDLSLFGGPGTDVGPTPTVTLASDASNSPQAASAACGRVSKGPAILFTSDAVTVDTEGSLGATGSVTTDSSITNLNKSTALKPDGTRCNADTGSEILTADSLSGSATASAAGVSGSTTVTNGIVDVHSNSFNCTDPFVVGCGGHTHTPDDPTTPLDESLGQVVVPPSPPVNYVVAGHVHLCDSGPGCTDYYVIAFNEQIANPDGSITVNPVHTYYGAKLSPNPAGSYVGADGSRYDIVPDLPYGSGGSVLHGHLYLGQVTAGVTTAPGANAAPVAGDDAYSTDYQTALTVSAPGVLGNDTDADGGTLTAGSASNPAGGSVTLNANGSFTYTPDAGFTGADSFTYTVTDDHGATDSGLVTITVGSPPPLPVADVAVDGTGPATLPTSTRQLPSVGSYSFTVTNNGPEAANATALSVTLAGARVSPSNVSTTSGSCTLLKGKTKGVNCTFGTLAAAGSATVTFDVKAPTKPGTLTLTGTASTTSDDQVPANNTDGVTTTFFRA